MEGLKLCHSKTAAFRKNVGGLLHVTVLMSGEGLW